MGSLTASILRSMHRNKRGFYAKSVEPNVLHITRARFFDLWNEWDSKKHLERLENGKWCFRGRGVVMYYSTESGAPRDWEWREE